MIFLQIDSLKHLGNNQSFWDHFIWPLLVVIVLAIFGLIWNFLIRKRIKIKINFRNSYRGEFSGNHYIILNTKIVNEKPNPIVVGIRANNMCNIQNGITGMTQGGRMPDGSVLFPAPIQLINDVMFPPININANNNRIGNIVFEIPSELLEKTKLEFSYLNKRKTKTIKIRKLQVQIIR